MPAALYTICHKDTRRVLAFASLEQRPLKDADAWKAFCTELVGENLILPTFAPHGELKIPADQLAVDEVDVDEATKRLLFDNLYAFEIAKPANPPTEPGDGQKKKLNTPGNTVTPSFTAASKLTITLTNPPTDPMNVCVLFEGEGPKAVTITAPNTTATFTVATTLVPTQRYLVVVMATGAPVFSGLVTA